MSYHPQICLDLWIGVSSHSIWEKGCMISYWKDFLLSWGVLIINAESIKLLECVEETDRGKFAFESGRWVDVNLSANWREELSGILHRVLECSIVTLAWGKWAELIRKSATRSRSSVWHASCNIERCRDHARRNGNSQGRTLSIFDIQAPSVLSDAAFHGKDYKFNSLHPSGAKAF